MNNASGTSVTPHVDKPKLIAVTPYPNKLHASISSHSVPQPREFNVMKHSNVIAPGMFKIDPSQTSRVDLVPNNQSSASIRTNPITNFQRHVTFKENVSSDMVNSSSTGILSLSKNQNTMSSERNNIKLAIRNDKSEIVCGTCKHCFVTTNHDACLLSSVNALNSRANNMCANVPPSANQKRPRTQVWKPKQVGFKERLAWIPKPGLSRFSLKWSSSRRTNKKTVSKFYCVSWQVVQICLWCVESGCSKHITGNIKLILNFVWMFLGTVRFGNDHIAAILGYDDLKGGNNTIIRVYFVEGLGNNLFLVGQFCDADLEVAFKRNTYFIRDLDCIDLLKGNHSTNLYTINLYDMASASPICLMARATPTKSWLWHQHYPTSTLTPSTTLPIMISSPIYQSLNMIKNIFAPLVSKEKAKEPLTYPNLFRIQSNGFICFIWICVVQCELQALMGEAIANACYTQNRSIIHRRFNKTPYELIQGRKLDISYLLVFWALCYPKNDREDIDKLDAKAPRIVHAAPVIQNLQALTASMGDLFVNPFATPSTESAVSSTQYVDPSNMHTFYQPYPHDYQWTKDHPLEQVIGEPSRPVLTRNQLKTDDDMCIYALTVSIMEPKTVKEALTDLAWIESMQEELHHFIRLDVWELVPLPDGITPLTLKSLLKNKHDEENTVIRNKTRLVVNQSPCGIFINQSNYVNEILKKYGLNTCDTIGTPIDIKDKLDLDQIKTLVDETKYHSMIGALIYLTSSRPDIVHATCDYGFELTGFSDADYAGCKHTFKSTSGGAQFLSKKLVSCQNRRDLPKDTPTDRLEVLRYDIRERSKVRMGIMSNETELTLEQTQQVTMEILLELTSSKLLVGDVGDSICIELVTLDINLGPE
nr:integrase, catalytic region, zinc finger, CCHC-type, peptidase aspartic, catalytic [Tanacetum cinerariifolium]